MPHAVSSRPDKRPARSWLGPLRRGRCASWTPCWEASSYSSSPANWATQGFLAPAVLSPSVAQRVVPQARGHARDVPAGEFPNPTSICEFDDVLAPLAWILRRIGVLQLLLSRWIPADILIPSLVPHAQDNAIVTFEPFELPVWRSTSGYGY